MENTQVMVAKITEDIEKLTVSVNDISSKIVEKSDIQQMIDDSLDHKLGSRLEQHPTTEQVSKMVTNQTAPINRSLKEFRDDFSGFAKRIEKYIEASTTRADDMDSQQRHNRRDIDLVMESNRKQDEKLATYKAVWDNNTATLQLLDDAIRGRGTSQGMVHRIATMENLTGAVIGDIAKAVDGITRNTKQIEYLIERDVEREKQKEQDEKLAQQRKQNRILFTKKSLKIAIYLLGGLAAGTPTLTGVLALIQQILTG